MSEPLYHIGQDVAVFAYPDYPVVIPKTKILDIDTVRERMLVHNDYGQSGVATRSFHAYLVEGTDHYVDQRYVRPINPDTEYLVEDNKVTAKS